MIVAMEIVGPAPTLRPMGSEGARVEDLDRKAIGAFLEAAEKTGALVSEQGDTAEDMLECLGLCRNGRVTGAGIVMFHPHPEHHLWGAYTRVDWLHRHGKAD